MSSEEIPTDTAPKSALQDNIDRLGKNAYYFAHSHKANGPKWDGKIEPRLLSSSSNLGSENGGDVSSGASDGVGGVEGLNIGATTNATTASSSAFSSKAISMSKSNINNYAFLDEDAKVKIYVNLPGVGKCSADNITLESTESSLCLMVKDYVASAPIPKKNLVEEVNDELISDSTEGLKDDAPEELEEPKGEDKCLSFAKLYGEIEKATFRQKADKIVITLVKKGDTKVWNSVMV